jgi:squalene cyclase
MRPGLAGDLLQAFDRAIKVSRKLPRGPIKRVAFERARTWIDEAQQDHGGWFSVRPTLLSLLALRVRGARSDDPRLRRGLDHLRRARGVVAGGERALAQGLSSLPVGIAAGLARAAGVDATAWLVAAEIGGSGPWQGRANAPAGGWPDEVGANSHLDLHTTCAVLDALHAGVGEHERGSESASAWPSVRRATDVILAMQEPDGSFARFERGESDVLLARFPWRDADQLAAGATDDVARVELTAMALRQLAALGRRSEDDRVERGLQWLAVQAGRHARAWSVPTLAAVGRCAAAHCPPGHDLRRGVEVRIRSRQREDGGFGGTVDTACALLAMLDLDGACVQATRAARDLVRAVEDAEDATSLGTGRAPGLGLSPQLRDVSAGVRHVNFALTRFRHAGGRL